MKWRPPGAQAVLDLRSVRVNDDWDAYQRFRRRRAHARRFPSHIAPTVIPEREILSCAA